MMCYTVWNHMNLLLYNQDSFYSGADQRKHQSSASLVFLRGIHRSPVNSPHKGPVMRKMFPFDDVIIYTKQCKPYGLLMGYSKPIYLCGKDDTPIKWTAHASEQFVSQRKIPYSTLTNLITTNLLISRTQTVGKSFTAGSLFLTNYQCAIVAFTWGLISWKFSIYI